MIPDSSQAPDEQPVRPRAKPASRPELPPTQRPGQAQKPNPQRPKAEAIQRTGERKPQHLSLGKQAHRPPPHVLHGKLIYLLALVTLVQIIYPITETNNRLLLIGYQGLYASLMVYGVLVARKTPHLRRLLVGFGVTWMVTGVVYDYNPRAIWAQMGNYSMIILYQAMLVQVLIRFMFSAHRVTRDVIYAASAIYLLLGGMFVPAYGMVETITMLETHHHAFVDNIDPHDPDLPLPWQTFVYYSFVTLTTAGYGDVLPVSMWARSLATLEAMVGVLYLTIVISRLVGLYGSHRHVKT